MMSLVNPAANKPVERSWSRLCQDLWSLTFEASHVIALRAFAVAAGGAPAQIEIDRMIEEKLKALWALQSLFVTGALGFNAPAIATRSVAHYRKAVRANRKRLQSKASRGRAKAGRR
jgi:hypothetical protein